MATRDDVARRAGVSSSTVSYVISGRRPISEATKRRVREAMQELNYTPDAFAKGLAGSRRGIIALHYPYSPRGVDSTEFEYVSAAAERARTNGFQLLLWTQPADDIAGLRSLVDQRLVDGVILMEVTPSDRRIAVMKASGTPFVLVGRPDDLTGLAYVDNDYANQADQAISYLVELGHQDVLFLGEQGDEGDRGYGPNVHLRRELARAAAQMAVRLTQHRAPTTLQGGRDALSRLMQLSPRPTAVLAFNGIAVGGLACAASSAGVAVPDDLTIVALSMGPLQAEMILPPVTTLSPSPAEIMRIASNSLAELIDGDSAGPVQQLVTPVLTIRSSSACRKTR